MRQTFSCYLLKFGDKIRFASIPDRNKGKYRCFIIAIKRKSIRSLASSVCPSVVELYCCTKCCCKNAAENQEKATPSDWNEVNEEDERR